MPFVTPEFRNLGFYCITSLGGRTITLDHQGDDPQHGEFLENARWVHEDIVFATLHLVGSANARRPFPGRTDGEMAEPDRRTAAAAAWLSETFTLARELDAPAVVLAFHAHVFFEEEPDSPDRRAYEPFLETLEAEVADFEGEVLAIHGDWHDYIVDQPLSDRTTSRTLVNFTRVQVPGSPAVGWVHVTVTPGSEELFRLEPRVVPYWPW